MLHGLTALLRRAPPAAAGAGRARRRGAVLLVAAVSALILVLVVGLVIDVGFAYGRKAALSKAVDAAALSGMGCFPEGEAQAAQIARAVFRANYRSDSLDSQPPEVDVRFSLDASGNEHIEVVARAHQHTLFMRVVPGFSELEIAASAQAMRSKLVLSLALDRSGSMRSNGGCSALPPAVDTFVTLFNDSHDRLALATYASNATLDVPLSCPFQSAIMAAVPRPCSDYDGYTYLDGGLALAVAQNEGAISAPGEEVAKVIVLFTDGLANTFQEELPCPTAVTRNLSSGDSGNSVHVLDPATGVQLCSSSNGGTIPCCPSLSTFPSVNGGVRYATGGNAGRDVRLEAKDRALATAKAARLAGNLIYTVGLGSNLDPDFLLAIANDPASADFDPTQPVGAFLHAPSAAELEDVFVQIAKLISLRISY